MNSKAFSLSLVIAIFSMYLVYTYIQGEKQKFEDKWGAPKKVVVAKVDINELSLIDDTKVKLKSVPREFVAPGAFNNVEDVYNTLASVPIKAGEQITKPRVLYPGTKTGLARQVSSEKRAVSIDVSPQQSVSQLVRPGDRVDIIAKIDYAGNQKDKILVKTVLQDVYILSTGQKVTRNTPVLGVQEAAKVVRTMKLSSYTNYNTVTIEVDPHQAQQVVFLKEALASRFYLVLRNNDDRKKVPTKATTLFDVMGDDRTMVKQYFNQLNSRR